ncbi:MAG: 50S ribosomal protein L15 [Candidatus Paraimprobicoccus trichonymphae]|uniref:Large ribosomal subunit protein uL15 n=1 Tax=Candidatus Paraimprobicoccus trichonymphae TaxID=3033793 RepID=A0AA48L1H3_9FIRM|nr:MAG: 50S ribosomal protein L15 [Candidatus Paraimprobicoccus trichonymphae]
MELCNITGPKNFVRKKRKRIGRGHGSGHGKTSGRGQKGQKARSGYSRKRGFEGGQTPLQRRIPKRGFNNIFAKKVLAINIEKLNIFEEDSVVSPEDLKSKKIIKKRFNKIKIIGNGKINKKLTIKAHKFSESAKEKVQNAGGKVEVI